MMDTKHISTVILRITLALVTLSTAVDTRTLQRDYEEADVASDVPGHGSCIVSEATTPSVRDQLIQTFFLLSLMSILTLLIFLLVSLYLDLFQVCCGW